MPDILTKGTKITTPARNKPCRNASIYGKLCVSDAWQVYGDILRYTARSYFKEAIVQTASEQP